MNSSVEHAKHFIVERILDKAKLEGVPLSDGEVRMLDFAEASASAQDLETAAAFERESDAEQYETRIAALLRTVYERDIERSAKEEWDRSLDALAEEDMYLLVLLERAGIVKTTTYVSLPDWRLLYGLIPILLCILLALVVAFSSWVARLIPDNSLRLGICILLLAAPILLNRLRAKGLGSRE
jgi:hypothetical protein